MIDPVMLAKFKRRAKLVATQSHLDKIILLFPSEHHEEIAAQIQPLLTKDLIARKVDALPEIQFANPEAPTLHEDTVQRLNAMAAEIDRLKAAQLLLLEQIQSLKVEAEDRLVIIEALKAENISLTAARETAIPAEKM